ncbi:MAG: nucleotidyltransferase domain-containing protein [Armatimonadota bacterium]
MPDVPWPDPQQRLENFIRDYLPRIVEQYAPTEVWVWGSMASGDPDDHSDLDLIIVSDHLDGGGPAERAIRLDGDMGIGDGIEDLGPVDLLCYTPEEFERQRSRITIVAEGIRKGKRLL